MIHEASIIIRFLGIIGSAMSSLAARMFLKSNQRISAIGTRELLRAPRLLEPAKISEPCGFELG